MRLHPASSRSSSVRTTLGADLLLRLVKRNYSMSKDRNAWFHRLAKGTSLLVIFGVLALSYAGTGTVHGEDAGIATPIATLQATEANSVDDSYKYDLTLGEGNITAYTPDGQQEDGYLPGGAKVEFFAKGTDSLVYKVGDKILSVKLAD